MIVDPSAQLRFRQAQDERGVSLACLDGRVSAKLVLSNAAGGVEGLDAARHERSSFKSNSRSYRAERVARSRDTALRLAGYAALFGVPDAARDTILPGAFAATLAERRERLPLYWQHRPAQRVGWVEMAREDARGLRVIARLDPGTRPADLLASRAVSGLSFGYRARDFRLTPQGRELAAVELFEVSLVTHPLQHGARVHWLSDPPRHGEVAVAASG